jgi:hypothetical protein
MGSKGLFGGRQLGKISDEKGGVEVSGESQKGLEGMVKKCTSLSLHTMMSWGREGMALQVGVLVLVLVLTLLGLVLLLAAVATIVDSGGVVVWCGKGGKHR